jgi:anti-sigma factor RsiW
MKCGYSENDIALYVERDIASHQARKIETHLSTCDACRELAEDLRETQSAFKSLRQDTVSAGALASVRTRVLAEVGARNVRPAWGRWVQALAGAGFVMVLAIGLAYHLRKQATPTPVAQQIVKISPVPAFVDASPYRARASRVDASPYPAGAARTTVSIAGRKGRPRSIKKNQREAAQTEAVIDPPRQLVVKLLTDDPNIVIYWIVDQNGGTL